MTGARTLVGKRVLVTGGASGIGRATVDLLAMDGAHVFVVTRDEDKLRRTLEETRHFPGRVLGLAADITAPQDVARAFAAMDEALGGLDILVNCAALGAEPLHEMADDEWRYVVDTNLVGCLACARQAIHRFEAQGGGHLLLVGSISVEIKAVGESVYSATKAGLQAFAETLRKEVAAKHILVSVVQPGSTRTAMQECDEEAKRDAVANEEMLEAEDVAEAIHFILTRPRRVDVVNLRIEPRLQKTA